MIPKSSVRLTQADPPMPTPLPMPAEDAEQWRSIYEENGLETNIKVFIRQEAYAIMCVHAAVDLEEERGGMLSGKWHIDEETGQEFIVIEHAIPAKYTRQGNVFLTFTQDSLVNFHNEIEKRYPSDQIVGWYHTHPKMGVFLSNYDTWLHSNFFPEPWQVALVIEPQKNLGGVFIRQKDGFLDPAQYFGFFEMVDQQQLSIVNWENLSNHKGSE